MNTNYDDEATQYQDTANEATQYEETSTTEKASSNDEVEVKAAKGGGWKRTAAGAGSGLLVGGVATALMGMKSADNPSDSGQESDNHKETLSNPEWVDDQIQVATSVNDDMSFGEAFAAARADVGPGGCFEWHGNVYGTYTADEWNHMTAEQRAEWSDHFSWNHIDHSSGNVAQHSTTAHTNHTEQAQASATEADDDIEVVSVNHNEGHNDIAHNTTSQNTNAHTASEDIGGGEVVVENAEPEIEILGVVHDSDTGANIGGMNVDGQEVIFIDVDGNMEFDYMAADLNGNGELDDNELVDIQGQGITVSDLGGFTDPAGDMLASNDAPDYSTDVYEG